MNPTLIKIDFLLILAVMAAMFLFGTIIWWRFNEWRQGFRIWTFPAFTIFELQIKILTGTSSQLDFSGNQIKGKFFTFRFEVLGLGIGLDYLLEAQP